MSERTISKKFLLVSFAVLVPAIGQLFIASPAHACTTADGQRFSPGETYGPYICMPDGTWQQQ